MLERRREEPTDRRRVALHRAALAGQHGLRDFAVFRGPRQCRGSYEQFDRQRIPRRCRVVHDVAGPHEQRLAIGRGVVEEALGG